MRSTEIFYKRITHYSIRSLAVIMLFLCTLFIPSLANCTLIYFVDDSSKWNPLALYDWLYEFEYTGPTYEYGLKQIPGPGFPLPQNVPIGVAERCDECGKNIPAQRTLSFTEGFTKGFTTSASIELSLVKDILSIGGSYSYSETWSYSESTSTAFGPLYAENCWKYTWVVDQLAQKIVYEGEYRVSMRANLWDNQDLNDPHWGVWNDWSDVTITEYRRYWDSPHVGNKEFLYHSPHCVPEPSTMSMMLIALGAAGIASLVNKRR